MKKEKRISAVFSYLVIFALLLSTFGAASALGGNTVNVSTVDELLAAIAPDTTIRLSRGTYDLSRASDYGTGSSVYYRWEEVYDGYELVISGADGLSLVSPDDDDVLICTAPRYANVLCFEKMSGLSMNRLTVGHTIAPGECSGGVIRLEDVDDITINDCNLYGCGIIGIDAYNCEKLYVYESNIYDCSNGAMSVSNCYDVRVYDSDIKKCSGWEVFSVNTSTGFALINCEIEKNSTGYMLSASYSPETYLLGCEVEENSFSQSMFYIAGTAPIVESSELSRNSFMAWFDSEYSPTPGMRCVDRNGEELSNEQLESMRQRDCRYDGPAEIRSKTELQFTQGENGKRVVKVKTAEEFIAAIGPRTNIMLEGDGIELSSVSDYGNGQYYFWELCYDGPQLVITNVEDLSITSEIMTPITTAPRYANVLSFRNCENLWLSGFTAGHTDEPGSCTGGVLDFSDCDDVAVDGCSLYGCGILGINAYNVDDLSIVRTEIYDCSQGAVSLQNSEDVIFKECDIHDCAVPEINVFSCKNVLYKNRADEFAADGRQAMLSDGSYALGEDNMPAEWDWQKNDYAEAITEPASISLYMDEKPVSTIELKQGESALLTAEIYLPKDAAVQENQIIWISPNDKMLTLGKSYGSQVTLTSHLASGEVQELNVYYLNNAKMECSCTLTVMG